MSSQCIKRAVRTYFRDNELIPPENLAVRTNRLAETVGRRLAGTGKDEDTARLVAGTALRGLGFGLDDNERSQYLIFLGESGVQALSDLCAEHWDTLSETAEKIKQAEEEGSARDAKAAKRDAKNAVPDEVRKRLGEVLDGSKTADLALFGRMLADLPGENIDAACQVAHAISTNRVSMEMDFYTAVDDLKPDEEDPGAGMMGVIGYNSACFYRYALLDYDKLCRNLGGDAELARQSVKAFLQASALALPTGKQNTFAAHSRPDLVMVACRRKGAPLSLANAFTQPAAPSDGKDLTQASVDKLGAYWATVTAVYDRDGEVEGPFFCATTPPQSAPSDWTDDGSLDTLVDTVLGLLKTEADR